jgi:hypothetical protein
MKTLTFTIEILSNKKNIWDVLWGKESYTKWTKPFMEGCYYETESFSKGNEIKFLAPNGDGMISKIADLQSQDYVAFEHLSMLEKGKESSFKTDGDAHQYIESYQLIENEKSVTLIAKVDTLESWVEMMNNSFPKALQIVKKISEL